MLSLLPVMLSPVDATGAQRFRWWKDEAFIREMALTPDQSARIETVFQAALPALRAQQRALSMLEEELTKLVQEATVEESELDHFVAKVEAARADLARSRTMMIYRIRRILTREQHMTLDKLFEQREKARRGKSHDRSQ